MIVSLVASALALRPLDPSLSLSLRGGPHGTRCPQLTACAVTYRPGTPEDLPTIGAAVLRESMNPLFLDPERFILACSDSRVLGFGQLRPASDGYELASLVVEPASRGRGYGSELVRRLLARAEGEPVWLLTLASTRSFYEPLGFEVAPDGAAPMLLRAEQAIGSVVAAAATGERLVCMTCAGGSKGVISSDCSRYR